MKRLAYISTLACLRRLANICAAAAAASIMGCASNPPSTQVTALAGNCLLDLAPGTAAVREHEGGQVVVRALRP